MPYLNEYNPPATVEVKDWHLSTPQSAYDLNFVFPVPPPLSSNGVSLVPLIVSTLRPSSSSAYGLTRSLQPSLHAEQLYPLLAAAPEVYLYLPYGPFADLPAFLTWLETVRRDSTTLLFAILDLSRGPAPVLAGIMGVLKSSRENRMSEIGHIAILPQFQRTHANTHAVALLLRWLFDDLHLRRVQWFANARNVPSINAAKRMGLAFEGEKKWDRVIAVGKEGGDEVPAWAAEEEARERRGKGRHSAVLGLGWDAWRESGSAHVDALMRREVVPSVAGH